MFISYIWILATAAFVDSTTNMDMSETKCSEGDRVPYHYHCLKQCITDTCTPDGVNFLFDDQQPIYLKLFYWTCREECQYQCMWKTIEKLHEEGRETPQFKGKWPFIRLLGIQEPASAFFSFLNLYSHWAMLKKYRKEVSPNNSLYGLWHFFCMISINAWVWSIVFHTRDVPWTEVMDYISSFSIVLFSCYVMIIRTLSPTSKQLSALITLVFVSIFIYHAHYLMYSNIDYVYNMKVNIVLGVFTGLFWLTWCIFNWKKQPYVWKCSLFIILAGLTTILEVVDGPPLFYVFDAHSLWHLSTSPLMFIFYSFIIDDAEYLRNLEAMQKKKSFEKEI